MKTPEMKHAHMYETRFEIVSLKKELTLRIPADSPTSALQDLHRTVQNTMHWNPPDYVVTFLKRDGMAAYEFPIGMTNPDVRRRPRGEKHAEPTLEMFPLEELKAPRTLGEPEDGFKHLPTEMGLFGHERAGIPSAVQEVDSPAANTVSQL